MNRAAILKEIDELEATAAALRALLGDVAVERLEAPGGAVFVDQVEDLYNMVLERFGVAPNWGPFVICEDSADLDDLSQDDSLDYRYNLSSAQFRMRLFGTLPEGAELPESGFTCPQASDYSQSRGLFSNGAKRVGPLASGHPDYPEIFVYPGTVEEYIAQCTAAYNAMLEYGPPGYMTNGPFEL